MVVTFFVSAPITCRMFVVGHSNFDTKYPFLSATNSNVVHFSKYHRIHYLMSNAMPLLQPTPLPGYVVTQPGVNCNSKIVTKY